jgi:hypothetical protein
MWGEKAPNAVFDLPTVQLDPADGNDGEQKCCGEREPRNGVDISNNNGVKIRTENGLGRGFLVGEVALS